MEYELVLRGGRVVDGSGTDAVTADVGVAAGRVAALDSPGKLRGATLLDADGLVVSPGFVDLHSHADFSLPAWPAADTALRQGVTTLLVGNCGFSPFPVGAADARAELREQSGFMADPMSWDWSDAAGYANALDARRPAVNVALQVGHHALRIAVMGSADRDPTPAELGAMCALVDQAAGQGAFGFSTGLIYAPGRFAGPEELTALATATARHGLLYSTHIRDETSGVVGAVREAIATAEASGVRLEISHLKAMGVAAHGSAGTLLGLIDDARTRGVDVAADAYPFTASSTTLSSRLPGWSLDGGAAALVHRLADPSARAAVARELTARIPGEVDPAGIVVAGLPPGPFSDCIGQSVRAIARRRGADPADTVLDLLAGHGGQVGIIDHSMTDTDLETILAHPRVSVASDGSVLRPQPPPGPAGLPHPRSFCTFSLFLSHYVRERHVVTLAEAVRKLTCLPAGRLGLAGRDGLRVGAVADIAVWDEQRLTARSTYADPWQLTTGVEHVLVGGVPAVRDGAVTGARSGAVLRRA